MSKSKLLSSLIRSAIRCASLVFSIFIALSLPAQAQLVADSATKVLDGVHTNISNSIVIGTNTSFTTLILTNGAQLTNSGLGTIGLNATSKSNLVVVTGAGSLWTNSGPMYVGNSGSFNHLLVSNGGTVATSYGYLGFSFPFGPPPSSSNNLVVVTGHGSSWNSGNSLDLGLSSQVIISNGGRLAVGAATLDHNSATITVTDAGSTWTNSNTIDIGSAASFNQLVVSNSAVVSDFSGSIGAQAGSNNVGIVTGTSSTWSNTFLFIGYWGGWSNRLTVSDGGRIMGQCVVGAGSPGFASYNTLVVSDPGSQLTVDPAGTVTVGQQGAFNQLVVSNGALVTDYSGFIGFGTADSSNNVIVVTGTGSVWSNSSQLQVGTYGSNNRLVVSNGATVSADSLIVGGGGTNNTVTVNDGTVIVTNRSASDVYLQGGSIIVNSGLLSAYTLFQASSDGQFTFNGGTLQSYETTLLNSFTIGSGSSPAIFELLGNGKHSFSNGVTISHGALLTGNGIIAANVTNSSGGTLSPGNSIGRLTIQNNLFLEADSTNIFELNKGVGTNDNITGLQTVTLGGLLVLTNLGGTLAGGDSFKLFTATNYGGSFSDVIAAPPGPGLWWDLSRLSIDGTLLVVPATNLQATIGNISLRNGTNFVLSAVGTPHGQVVVWSSTNLTAPMSNWTPWNTNLLDATGNASITNPIALPESKRFFRLITQ